MTRNESCSHEPVVGQTVIGGQPLPVLRFMGFPPSSGATGDLDSGSIREIVPAGHRPGAPSRGAWAFPEFPILTSRTRAVLRRLG